MRRASGLQNLPVARANRLAGEETFAWWCERLKLPKPVRNFRFHKTRRFEIDWAWPDLRMGIDIQGGIWNGGKHGRPSGIVRACRCGWFIPHERWPGCG